MVPYTSPAPSAGWQSGYAADCKSAHPGSIPGPASNAPGDTSGGMAGAALL